MLPPDIARLDGIIRKTYLMELGEENPLEFEPNSPEKTGAAEDEVYTWRTAVEIAGDEVVTYELMFEATNTSPKYLTVVWVLFPTDEVSPRLAKVEAKLLKLVNEANAELGAKFRLVPDGDGAYLSCEADTFAEQATQEWVQDAVNATLDVLLTHYPAFESCLA